MSALASRVAGSAPALSDDRVGQVGFGTFEGATGFMLRIAQQVSLERFYSRLSGLPATVGEFTILMTIGENPGIRQGALADVLRIKWPNMTKLIRGLDERDMLRRIVPPQDRRAVELHLTAKGEHLVAEARADVLAADRDALGMLGDDEYRQLLRLLRRVAGREGEVTG